MKPQTLNQIVQEVGKETIARWKKFASHSYEPDNEHGLDYAQHEEYIILHEFRNYLNAKINQERLEQWEAQGKLELSQRTRNKP